MEQRWLQDTQTGKVVARPYIEKKAGTLVPAFSIQQ
jgi:hypothetical protein